METLSRAAQARPATRAQQRTRRQRARCTAKDAADAISASSRLRFSAEPFGFIFLIDSHFAPRFQRALFSRPEYAIWPLLMRAESISRAIQRLVSLRRFISLRLDDRSIYFSPAHASSSPLPPPPCRYSRRHIDIALMPEVAVGRGDHDQKLHTASALLVMRLDARAKFL